MAPNAVELQLRGPKTAYPSLLTPDNYFVALAKTPEVSLELHFPDRQESYPLDLSGISVEATTVDLTDSILDRCLDQAMRQGIPESADVERWRLGANRATDTLWGLAVLKSTAGDIRYCGVQEHQPWQVTTPQALGGDGKPVRLEHFYAIDTRMAFGIVISFAGRADDNVGRIDVVDPTHGDQPAELVDGTFAGTAVKVPSPGSLPDVQVKVYDKSNQLIYQGPMVN